MKKKIMHYVPNEARVNVHKRLEVEDLYPVHIAYASMFEKDNNEYVLIANRECEGIRGYYVYCYDLAEDEIHMRGANLIYADALILMGEIIKE